MIKDYLPYVLAMVLFSVGLYAVVCKKNLIKIMVGIIVMEYAVELFLVLMSYKKVGMRSFGAQAPILTRELAKAAGAAHATMVDPVPQALILTSIVIGLATVALMVALALRIHEKYGTFDITEIRRLRG